MTDSDFTVRKGLLVRDGNVSLRGDNKELRFYEGANYVGFEAPALSADKIWVLPAADGSTGQALKTDGSGNLGWVTAGDVTLTGTQTLTNKTYGPLSSGYVVVGASNDTAAITSNGAHNLHLSTNSNSNSGSIYIVDGANGDIVVTPNGTGDVVLDGLNWPQADGSANQVLKTDGSAQLSWATVSSGASDIDGLSDAITTATSNIGLGSGALDSLTASSGNYNSAVGKDALTAVSTGDYNVAFGFEAGAGLQTGSQNIFLGSLAGGNSGTDAAQNVIVGYQSAYSATSLTNSVTLGYEAGKFGMKSASNNIAIGHSAMKGHSSNSTGANYNLAIGTESLEAITTGDYNVGVGYKSLEAITSGLRNVAIGANSLDAITTHSNLTAVGHNAGTAVTSSNNLTAIGYESANALTSQIECTYVGYHSGNGATGTHNTGIGMNAGKSITGNFNVAVGRNVAYFGGDMDMTTAIGCEAGFFWGNTPTVHDYTVAVGYQAGYKGGTNSTYVGAVTAYNQTGAYSVAVGYQALRSTMGAGAGAGNTAIGTQSMYGGVGAISGANNTFTGYKSGYLVSSGTGNAGFGYEALDNVRDGSKNIAIGYQSGDSISSGSNNVVIGKADVADATASDQLSISSGDGSPVWMTSDSTGVVDFPNGLTNNGSAVEAAFETITDVTIGSGTSGTTSGIYFGANNEAGVVAGEISNQSVASDGYIELMNCDLDAESGASGLQTIELTVQIQDETNNNVESFKALVQGIEKTVLGTTVREVNYTEWAIIYTSGANRIGQLEADYDSSDDTIRIRYKHTQSSTATLTATFYAVTMQNNT